MGLYASATLGFQVVVAAGGDSVVIRPRGELDLATADRLAAALRAVDASATVVVLDLSGLSFLDAAGLRVLIEGKQALRERLTLLPGPPAVQRLIALTRSADALGLSPGATEDDMRAAAANISYMRELWQAYRAGGTQALAERMPSHAPAGGDRPVWGAGELSSFWAHTIVPVPDAAASYRIQPVGNSVFVSADTVSPPERSGVIWSLYVFKGRTFIRALSLSP